MKGCLLSLVILAAFITPSICLVKKIQFDQHCSGYLKQAADAATPELALERLNLAIDYLDKHGLTSGYTSVLYKTEDENIGFWYNNLKNSQAELEACIEGTRLADDTALKGSQFERSNVLMKVRESLTDNGEEGTVITVPPGISRYPHNFLYGLFNWISLIVFVVGALIIFGDF